MAQLEKTSSSTFAQRFRDFRLAAGLSQRVIAEQIGIKQQSIVHWESGRSLPGTEHLPAVAKLLGVRVADLFNGDEDQGDLAQRVEEQDHKIEALEKRWKQAEKRLTTMNTQLAKITELVETLVAPIEGKPDADDPRLS